MLKHILAPLAALAAAAAALPAPEVRFASSAADDVVIVPWPTAPSTKLNATSWSGVVPSTGTKYTAHVGIQAAASLFSIELGADGCATHRNTSVTAREFNCELATNGGFFAFTPPACEGNLIINSSVVQYPGLDRVNVAVMANGSTAMGYVSPANVGAYNFTSLLQGYYWLVRDGATYVQKSHEFTGNSSFVTEKAPRTGVGITRDGAVMLLVVDGIEVTGVGIDLYEFAEIFMSVGAFTAINVDGGGSSDAVLDGAVWSYPTCNDTPVKCERAVSSITCLRYGQ